MSRDEFYRRGKPCAGCKAIRDARDLSERGFCKACEYAKLLSVPSILDFKKVSS